MWVYDSQHGMVLRDISFVPGLYKIFDEIIVDIVNNQNHDQKNNCIRIDIDTTNTEISIYTNGCGSPVLFQIKKTFYITSMFFSQLLTSPKENEKKVVGDRDIYGAELCNIFSTMFKIESSSRQYNNSFSKVWTDNMKIAEEPIIRPPKDEDFTRVTFKPDLRKFNMTHLDKDIVDLFSRRAYDIAGSSKGLKVFLNDNCLPVRGFQSYVDLFFKDKNNEPLKLAHEVVNDCWEIGVAFSEKSFRQISFVNNIATTRGGTHVDHVVDQIIDKLIKTVKKESGNSKVDLKPDQIRNHLWVFVNCFIENPTFDSQTKEMMTSPVKTFGSSCSPTDNFFINVFKVGIVKAVLSRPKFKSQPHLTIKKSDSTKHKTWTSILKFDDEKIAGPSQVGMLKPNDECHSTKRGKFTRIPKKLVDANFAGTKNSNDCTLILTEGDSSKTFASTGLSVVGRNNYGILPLCGTLLNVREATYKQILENSEINNIIDSVGLQYKEKYKSNEDLKSLRYGKIMIITDQDDDGAHIRGLIISFFQYFWPSLLKLNFLEMFITPIVKASKGDNVCLFYSIPEFEEWKKSIPNWRSYHTKYYKGNIFF